MMNINDWINLFTSSEPSCADVLLAYRKSLDDQEERARMEEAAILLNPFRPDSQTKLRYKKHARMRTCDITDIIDTVERMGKAGHSAQEIKDAILSERPRLVDALNNAFENFCDQYGEKRYKSGKCQVGRARIIENTLYISKKFYSEPVKDSIVRDFHIIEDLKCKLDAIFYLKNN